MKQSVATEISRLFTKLNEPEAYFSDPCSVSCQSDAVDPAHVTAHDWEPLVRNLIPFDLP